MIFLRKIFILVISFLILSFAGDRFNEIEEDIMKPPKEELEGDMKQPCHHPHSFPGGSDSLCSYLTKKIETDLKNKEGYYGYYKVFIKEGEITEVNVKLGVTPEIDESIKNILKNMPAWPRRQCSHYIAIVIGIIDEKFIFPRNYDDIIQLAE